MPEIPADEVSNQAFTNQYGDLVEQTGAHHGRMDERARGMDVAAVEGDLPSAVRKFEDFNHLADKADRADKAEARSIRVKRDFLDRVERGEVPEAEIVARAKNLSAVDGNGKKPIQHNNPDRLNSKDERVGA